MFSLGPDGLVEDYTIVTSANISIEFYINNALAYEFTNNGILSFNMTLSCTDQNFINTYIASPTINNSINVESTFIDNELNSSVQYEISSVGTTTVNVTYEVTDVGDTNNMYMADLYYSNKPTFSFSIRSN